MKSTSTIFLFTVSVFSLSTFLIAPTTLAAKKTVHKGPYNALAATLKSDTTTGVFNESDPLKPNTQVSGKVWSKNGSTFMVRLPKDDAGYNILVTKGTEITLNGKSATAKNIVKGVAVTVTGTLDTATYTLKADRVELGKSVESAETPVPVADVIDTPTNKTNKVTPETKSETANPSKISKTLKQGEKNAEVKKLQDKLVKLGFLSKENATGYYGTSTTKAVKAFQKAHKLDSVGFVGTKTLNELNK